MKLLYEFTHDEARFVASAKQSYLKKLGNIALIHQLSGSIGPAENLSGFVDQVTGQSVYQFEKEEARYVREARAALEQALRIIAEIHQVEGRLAEDANGNPTGFAPVEAPQGKPGKPPKREK